MSPENKDRTKGRLSFSPQAARQFRARFGVEPPGEVRINDDDPPVTNEYSEWERAKFSAMVGQEPKGLVIDATPYPYFVFMRFRASDYDVHIIVGGIKGADFTPELLNQKGLTQVDTRGKTIRMIQEEERGISIFLGEPEDEIVLRAAVWSAERNPLN